MTFHGKIWNMSTNMYIYSILSCSWKCSVGTLFWMQRNSLQCILTSACSAQLATTWCGRSLLHLSNIALKKIQSTTGFNCDMMWHNGTDAMGCKVSPNSWQRMARMSSCFKCSLSSHGRNTLMSSWVCRIEGPIKGKLCNCVCSGFQLSTYFPLQQAPWSFRTYLTVQAQAWTMCRRARFSCTWCRNPNLKWMQVNRP